ncbi:MAG: hypothetical protein ACOYVF_04540, partial [Candidatus Zixiibacteriota bacterium]
MVRKEYFFALLLIGVLLFGGCRYRIKYNLSRTETERARTTQPCKIAVCIFNDKRDDIEKQKDTRKEAGDKDAGDYTYDKDFEGEVAFSITDMTAQHLGYAHTFQEVTLLPYRSSAVNVLLLDSLRREGIDAVLTGDVRHFFGYYNHKTGSETFAMVGGSLVPAVLVAFLTTTTEKHDIYMPFGGGGTYEETKVNYVAITAAAFGGGMIGTLLESSSNRRIAWHTRLDLALVSTVTGENLWEGPVENTFDDQSKKPGLNTSKRKQEVAVASLKET